MKITSWHGWHGYSLSICMGDYEISIGTKWAEWSYINEAGAASLTYGWLYLLWPTE